MRAPYLASSLVNLFKPENKSQYKSIQDHISSRINDFLIITSKRITLYSNLLTFRDSNKSFKLDGDLFERMTNYDFNVNHANTQDQKLNYEFGKEMKFDIKQKGRKSNRDRSPKSLLKSPSLLVSASGVSNTVFLASDSDEFCDRLELIL